MFWPYHWISLVYALLVPLITDLTTGELTPVSRVFFVVTHFIYTGQDSLNSGLTENCGKIRYYYLRIYYFRLVSTSSTESPGITFSC
jgi:hypothetical protein